MCDSLGTILVDHLSKKDLASGDMQQVIFYWLTFEIFRAITFTLTSVQVLGEPHELVELKSGYANNEKE